MRLPHSRLPMGLDWGAGILCAAVVSLVASGYVFKVVQACGVGWPRRIAAIPVLVAYVFLPWVYDPTTHVLGTATLFCIYTWISSFRLLSLCRGHGAAADPWVLANFLRFHIVLSLPVNIRPSGPQASAATERDGNAGPLSIFSNDVCRKPLTWTTMFFRTAPKVALLAVLVKLYDFREHLPAIVLHLIYSTNLFLFATIVTEGLAALASAFGNVRMEVAFDKPWLATSLEDFWAHRWNRIVSSCLREAVYDPFMSLLSNSRRAADEASGGPCVGGSARVSKGSADTGEQNGRPQVKGAEGAEQLLLRGVNCKPSITARFISMLATFFVSGLMHELAVYYLTFKVTGEMTAFFTLHGLATGLEMALKRRYKRNGGLPQYLSRPLTIMFCFFSAMGLFFAPIIRSGVDVQAINEIKAAWLAR